MDKNKNISNKKFWANIDTVLLDMDGTLLDLHFDNHFWLSYVPKCFAEKHQLTDEQAHQQLMKKYGEVRGSLNWYCVDFWSQELSLDIKQLKHDISDKISIRPEVDEFLNWLNHHDKRVVLVTNAHPVSLWLKMDKTGLHAHFDKIIHSHELGLAKEQKGFWHKLQSLETYQAYRTMLIDDNIEVLDSANEYGIKTCLAIHLPDSQGEVVENESYPALKSFKEIMF